MNNDNIGVKTQSRGNLAQAFDAKDQAATTPTAKRKAGVVGSLAKAMGLSALAALIVTQGLSIGLEAYGNSKGAGEINAMRTEQAWLVGQGIAIKRPLGVIPMANLHPDGPTGGSAYSGSRRMLLGWEASPHLKLLDSSLLEPFFGVSIIEPVIGIAPATNPAETSRGKGIELAYRHEEGHSRARNKPADWALGAPVAWSAEAAAAVNEVIARNGAQRRAWSGEPGKENWRAQWLSGLRSEAFADAFAVLANARRGERAYRETAIDLHAARIFGEPTTLTSVKFAGEEHAVDMASFMTAQLDVEKVAKLSSRGLDELAGKIADESWAWAVARQGMLTGFFSPEGKEWWLAEAAKAKRPAGESALAWEQWKRRSSQIKPIDVFGEKNWTVEGMSFRASGLPSAMSRSAAWRFDGFGGTFAYDERVELGPGGPIQKGEIRKMSEAASGDLVEKLKERIITGAIGAISTHWELARMIGADLEQELLRIQKTDVVDNSVVAEGFANAADIHDLDERERATEGKLAKLHEREKAMADKLAKLFHEAAKGAGLPRLEEGEEHALAAGRITKARSEKGQTQGLKPINHSGL